MERLTKRTTEEIKGKLELAQKEDSADGVAAWTVELFKTITDGILLDRLEEICNAERDGRCVVLPCEKSELDEMLNDLEAVGCADERETYTTGYRNGYRNGRVELLKYILGSADGTRKATETALREREQDDD